MGKASSSKRSHYDNITELWKAVIGDNFHFGYFLRDDDDLREATDRLTDEVAKHVSIDENTRILDVGCGIGKPAFYLHEKHGCRITGISSSKKGIELAKEELENLGYPDKIEFLVADAKDNGLPDESYDLVWVMETSHLILRKRRLINECFRVLKKGGEMVLCDIILKKKCTPFDRVIRFIRHFPTVMSMGGAFGRAVLEALSEYERLMFEAGFSSAYTVDITKETMATVRKWRESMNKNRDTIKARFGEEHVWRFRRGCDALEYMLANGTYGYGIVKASKE